MTFAGITQSNHNPLLGQVEGADGIKTGFTNQSGFGFLGSAVRDGRRLAMVIAGAGSARDRNRASRALIEWGFTAFEARFIQGWEDMATTARVQNGSSREVRLRSKAPLSIIVPKSSEPKVSMKIHYHGPLRAPISAGTEVAELEIAVEGMPTSFIPLYAGEDIDEAGFLRRIWNGILGWIT